VVDMMDRAGCCTDAQRTDPPSRIFLTSRIYAAGSLALNNKISN